MLTCTTQRETLVGKNYGEFIITKSMFGEMCESVQL